MWPTDNILEEEGFMKLSKLFVVLAVVLFAGACATTAPEPVELDASQSSAAGIATSDAGINSLERGDYEVLGRVSGSGTVSVNLATNDITGDTGLYGFLGDFPSGPPSVRVERDDTPEPAPPRGLIGNILAIFFPPPRPAPPEISASRVPGSPRSPRTQANTIARSNAAYEMIMEARELDADAIIFITETETLTVDGDIYTNEIELTGRAIRINN